MITDTAPCVSVVMSVYNGEQYLVESIQSILNQTYSNFEFIIINDGSTDQTEKIIKSYKDPRITLIDNSINHGLVYSLNLGFSKARGKYIARMDADDISRSDRLAKQVEFLEGHSDIGIVGSNCICIDENGHRLFINRKPALDLEIRWVNLLQNPFVHSSVMIRKCMSTDNEYIYPSIKWVEDYMLWSKLLSNTKGANLSLPLIKVSYF